MKFGLKRPCTHCPFRQEMRGVVRKARAQEIVDALTQQDSSFDCHKTVDYEGREHGCEDTSKRDFCAGALLMLRQEELLWGNMLTRMAVRFGMLDPDALEGDVHESFEAFILASQDGGG